jgi:predicted nucleic-acid-binding Zn-ribbon protein
MLSPYDPNSVCPKCGNTDIASQYHDGRECDEYGSHCPAPVSQRTREHISRHCKRCHYAFAEAVLGLGKNHA